MPHRPVRISVQPCNLRHCTQLCSHTRESCVGFAAHTGNGLTHRQRWERRNVKVRHPCCEVSIDLQQPSPNLKVRRNQLTAAARARTLSNQISLPLSLSNLGKRDHKIFLIVDVMRPHWHVHVCRHKNALCPRARRIQLDRAGTRRNQPSQSSTAGVSCAPAQHPALERGADSRSRTQSPFLASQHVAARCTLAGP